ncbi:MAG: hypothetical protein ACK5RL_02390 [Acidimicrobiales bacterium]
MARSTIDLDTPFRPGEKVMTTVPMEDLEEGARGKVRVANGIGAWRRYWVRFNDGRLRGQISQDDLVRPGQLDEWRQREADRATAAERAEQEADTPAVEAAGGDAGGGDGIASQIPAHLLERSKAAKTRLLG